MNKLCLCLIVMSVFAGIWGGYRLGREQFGTEKEKDIAANVGVSPKIHRIKRELLATVISPRGLLNSSRHYPARIAPDISRFLGFKNLDISETNNLMRSLNDSELSLLFSAIDLCILQNGSQHLVLPQYEIADPNLSIENDK